MTRAPLVAGFLGELLNIYLDYEQPWWSGDIPMLLNDEGTARLKRWFEKRRNT
jgi:hypothetical protein